MPHPYEYVPWANEYDAKLSKLHNRDLYRPTLKFCLWLQANFDDIIATFATNKEKQSATSGSR